MSAEKPMNATIRRKQKQSEQRRIMIILITFVLIIFSLGTIFGCFLCSAFTPDTVNAAEETKPTATQTEAPAVALCTLEIKSAENTLDAELQATMLEMC